MDTSGTRLVAGAGLSLRNEDMFCQLVVERRPHPMSLLLGGVISIALFFGIAAAASGVHIAGSPNSFTSALAKSFWSLWPRKDFVPSKVESA